MNPNECKTKKDCRISEIGAASTTCAYYPPTFDGNGNNINPDGNNTSGKISCSKCCRSWSYSTRYGKTIYVIDKPEEVE